MLPSLSSLTIRHFSPPNRRIESGLVFQTNVPPRQQQKVCDLRSRAAGKARSENLDDLMLLGGMLPPVVSPSGRAAPSVPSLLVPADQLREEAGLGRPVEQKQKGPTGQTLPSPPVLNYADKVGNGNTATISHFIYLQLKETSFVSEEVGRSVIVNSGGNLESSRVLFADNIAESLIEAKGGATVLLRERKGWSRFDLSATPIRSASGADDASCLSRHNSPPELTRAAKPSRVFASEMRRREVARGSFVESSG